jgi:hypothetical protein
MEHNANVSCPRENLLQDGPKRSSIAGMEDQPSTTNKRQERIFNGGFTGREWIGVLVVTLMLTTRTTTQNHVGLITEPASWLGEFFASLLPVVVAWVAVRAIFRWITKKKPVA